MEKYFDREKRGQGSVEYLLIFSLGLILVTVTLTMLLDLDPNFQVTGNPTITNYSEDGVTVNLADVSVAPSDALIEEISLVIGDEEVLLVGPFEGADRVKFDELDSVVYRTDTGTGQREEIGILVIRSNEGDAVASPVKN